MALREYQYRTFDQLLSAVLSDFKTYDQEGMIDPQDLIKIAQKVNRQLGVKIHRNKQRIIELNKGKVRLPNDYYKLNVAIVLGEKEVKTMNMQGVQTEDIVLPADCNNPSPLPGSIFNSTCRPGTARVTECGQEYAVVQHFSHQQHIYHHLHKLRIKPGPDVLDQRKHHEKNTPETHESDREAYIKNGWLYCNFDTGKIYIDYVSEMEDEDGNLLVLDDDIINEYYEYAMKERILENLMIEGEDVANKLNMIAGKRRTAHIEAVTRAGMYEFDELAQIWEANRLAMYKKYYYQFV